MQDGLYPAFTEELIVGVHTPTAAAIVGKSTPGCMVKTCLCSHCGMMGHEMRYLSARRSSQVGGRGGKIRDFVCLYVSVCNLI